MKKALVFLFSILFTVLSVSCQRDTNKTISNLTDSDIAEISAPLIEESLKIYSKVMGLYLENGEEISENGLKYYKLKDISTKAELWEMINAVYTENSAKRIFNSNINGDDNYTAKFIEKDGSLYASRVIPSVGLDCYPLKSVKCLEKGEDSFTILADFYYTTSILNFIKGENGWRIDNSVIEGEKNYVDSLEKTTCDSIFSAVDDNLILYTKDIQSSNSLTFNEAKSIFLPLFERSWIIYHNYIKNSPSFNMGNITPDFKIEKTEYHFVQFPELKTLDDVWQSAYGAYTEECASRLFSYHLDQTNSEARYTQREGKLYYCPYGHGNITDYVMSSIQLTAQYENLLVFTLDKYVFDDYEEKSVFVLQKTPAGWRMANGFDERVIIPELQYIDINFDKTTEAKTFNLASKQHSSLPSSFEYNGNTVTVNAPIFTGLKTENVYTYKQFFAFENGKLVFTVLETDESGNTSQRYILIDRNGYAIDTDFTAHTVVNDRATISTYPDGIEKLQTGESGNYKQQLVNSDGKSLSEQFDEIGFFNHGLALARNKNKIGIISINGETLLEPCIQIDDIRYTPDFTRRYQVLHLTNDAFVVPINGELAIITLTRQ